ncbi:hypothetical protein QR680_010762 [Steinernema hermaphroditum]|uniref:Chromo domain-containing protein n=1 Tax=Steinernema hermaphroditum TaxID=289476 RepID=A0AA39MC36_9BILA|nr:hypothetical protein QR680_010762 [Steinernema hermaphroditum]
MKRKLKSYPVEEVLAKKVNDDGVTEYLVRWVGYEQCTWEPEDHFIDKDVIQIFEAESRETNRLLTETRKYYNRIKVFKIQKGIEVLKIRAVDKNERRKDPYKVLLLVHYVDGCAELVPSDLVYEKYPERVNNFLLTGLKYLNNEELIIPQEEDDD